MTTRDDIDRQLDGFLRDGPVELPAESYVDVRDRIDQTRQRVVIGPWRLPDMHKIVPIGIGAAAVAVVLVTGTQLLGGTAPSGVGSAPTASPSSTTAPPTASPSSTPVPPVAGGLPEGPFVITTTGDPVKVTVDLSSPGWTSLPDFDAVVKDDDGLDPPQTVGAALLAWSWPAGTGFDVYGDPCRWSTTIPATPATTPAEIAAALAAQATRDATAPRDVTIDGYAGKAVTLHVPLSYEVADASREGKFSACDQDVFASYGISGESEPSRYHQGPGQVDELWILDVGGRIVILDAMSSPATPDALVDELRALAESATFE